eukprot:scaffold46649_cov22-Tisochrysis_lutea.AAC.1
MSANKRTLPVPAALACTGKHACRWDRCWSGGGAGVPDGPVRGGGRVSLQCAFVHGHAPSTPARYCAAGGFQICSNMFTEQSGDSGAQWGGGLQAAAAALHWQFLGGEAYPKKQKSGLTTKKDGDFVMNMCDKASSPKRKTMGEPSFAYSKAVSLCFELKQVKEQGAELRQ